MARRRIGIVTTSYPLSAEDPSGHFVAAEARALAAAGHEVTVIAPGAARAESWTQGVRVLRVADAGASGWPGLLPRLRERPARALGVARWVLGARRELSRRGPFDRVIAHWLVPSAFPVALAVSSTPFEVVVHGSDARLLAALPRPLGRAVLSRLNRRGAELRCVSEELAALLRGLAGDAALRVRVEPAPIDLEGAPHRELARRELGVAPGSRLIVVVARLLPDKRVGDALIAASLVPDADVVVVGDGPLRAELERHHPGARFVGRLPRARALAWIAAADVLLSASRLEGAPTAVREARALGVRVVATDAGDLARWAERDAGLYVVP